MTAPPINGEDIECLAIGSWISGTICGGSPNLGLRNTRLLDAEGHRPALISPLDLAHDAWVEMGSIASTCKAPRTGSEIKECGIYFTTSKAIGIGRRVREANRRHDDPVAAVLDEAQGKILFRGKVVDVARRATEGFLRGRCAVEGLDEDRGARLELAFQNEWVVAWRAAGRDLTPVAMSPDLICVLDTVSGNAFGTETIRYGMRVTVVALPAPPVFLTPKGLDHVGPRAFGYDLDFKSVFDASPTDP